MTSASIDELLRYDDESAAPRPGRGLAATVLRTVLLAGLGTAVITLGFRVVGITVSVPLVGTALLALLSLRHLVRVVTPGNGRRAGSVTGQPADGDGGYQWPAPDAMRRAVLRWEQRLAWHADAPGSFDEQLRPFLREMADERLRHGYGVTIAGEPTRARAVLGEPLWSVLTGEHRRGPSHRELATAVTRLEELKMTTTGQEQGRG